MNTAGFVGGDRTEDSAWVVLKLGDVMGGVHGVKWAVLPSWGAGGGGWF